MGTLREHVDDLERRARAQLPAAVHDYVWSGSGTGATRSEAVAAWDAVRLRPRALQAIEQVETATTMLGTPVSCPVAVAPTTLQRAADPRGEVAMAEGVRDAGSLMVVPSNAGLPFEEISGTGVRWWFQLYVTHDRARCLRVLERAVRAGAEAVVLTVDTPVVARKPAPAARVWNEVPSSWVRANFESQADADADKAPDLGPSDIGLLHRSSGLPVVVKGVVRRDTAQACVDAGAAAVWVSNHGGRQLDRTVSSVAALAELSAPGQLTGELYVDGGVRDAGHVLSACALGARGCFLGRPAYAALAAGGSSAVTDLLERMTDELAEQLLLVGAPAPSALDADMVVDRIVPGQTTDGAE